MRDASSEKRATAAALVSPESESQPVRLSAKQIARATTAITPRPSAKRRTGARNGRGSGSYGSSSSKTASSARRSSSAVFRYGQPDFRVVVVHDDELVRLALEAVPRAVDLLRPSVGRGARFAAERAQEEVQLEAERDEEHRHDRDRVPQLARAEDPGEHEDDERDAHPRPPARARAAHSADRSGAESGASSPRLESAATGAVSSVGRAPAPLK